MYCIFFFKKKGQTTASTTAPHETTTESNMTTTNETMTTMWMTTSGNIHFQIKTLYIQHKKILVYNDIYYVYYVRFLYQ